MGRSLKGAGAVGLGIWGCWVGGWGQKRESRGGREDEEEVWGVMWRSFGGPWVSGVLWGSTVPTPAVLLSPAELLLPGLLCLPPPGWGPPRTPPGPPKPEAKTIVPAPAPTPPGPQEVDVSTPRVTPDPRVTLTPHDPPTPGCPLSLPGNPPPQGVVVPCPPCPFTPGVPPRSGRPYPLGCPLSLGPPGSPLPPPW